MKIKLRVQRPRGDAFEWEYAGAAIQIGRDPDCELNFQGEAAQIVSWHHARIEAIGRSAVLTDAGSNNGTFVNGKTTNAAVALEPGDQVQLGRNGPRIEILEISTAEPAAARVVAGATTIEPAILSAAASSAPPAAFHAATAPASHGLLSMLPVSPPVESQEHRSPYIVWITLYWLCSAVLLVCLALVLSPLGASLASATDKLDSFAGAIHDLAAKQRLLEDRTALVVLMVLIDLAGVLLFHLGLLTIVACYGLWNLRGWGLSLSRPLAAVFVVFNCLGLVLSIYTRVCVTSTIVALVISIAVADYLFGTERLSGRIERYTQAYRIGRRGLPG